MAYFAFWLVIIKVVVDFTLYIIKKINAHSSEQLNSDETSCIYCQMKDSKYVCTNLLFRRKMKKSICPREKCWGFNTNQSKIDNTTTLVNTPLFFSIRKAISLFPEIAAALLALNEIIST